MTAPDPSKLDLQQILQRVYDEAAGKLRTSATASIGDITVAVDLTPTDDGVYIADKDTGNKLKIDANGAVSISVQETSLRFDQVSSSVLYLGEGTFGALDNEAKWKIKKIVITGNNVDIKNASNTYNQVWTNRTGLAYV